MVPLCLWERTPGVSDGRRRHGLNSGNNDKQLAPSTSDVHERVSVYSRDCCVAAAAVTVTAVPTILLVPSTLYSSTEVTVVM